MTEPTNIKLIVLNAPDLVAPEAVGPLDGETIASVYLDISGLVPKGSCPIKFSEENYVNVECTTAEQLKAFQERLQKARDGFLYDANNDPHDGKKQVMVTQEQIDRAVEVAKDMILKTGSVSRAEVFKKAGIVANAGEFELIFRWRGFDLNTLTKGGLEDLLETNRTRAAEVFETNLRGAFANNSKHAMVVKFWDGDGDLATRNDQYWVDGAIYDAALAVIEGNLKALSPPSEPAAAVTATAAAQPPSPQPSPIKGEGKEGVVTQVPSPPVPVPSVVEGGEGAKDDGGIDLGFWGWSGVVAWGIASLALFFRSSRQRVLHALTAPMPPEGPHDRRVVPNAIGGLSSPHLRERLAAHFYDSWIYDDSHSDFLQRNARMHKILYNLVQCTSDDQAVDYLLREAAFAQKMTHEVLLARLEKATGGQELSLAEQAVYYLHLIADPDMRVDTAVAYKGGELKILAKELKAPPPPVEEEGKGAGGQTRGSAPTKGAVSVGADQSVRPEPAGGPEDLQQEARLDAIGEDWFFDEDGRKGATADRPPPLPEAESKGAEPPSPQPSPIEGEGKEGGAIQVPSPPVPVPSVVEGGEGKREGEPAKPAGKADSKGTSQPRRRRHPAGRLTADGPPPLPPEAKSEGAEPPSPQPSPIEGEGERASVPAASPPPMPEGLDPNSDFGRKYVEFVGGIRAQLGVQTVLSENFDFAGLQPRLGEALIDYIMRGTKLVEYIRGLVSEAEVLSALTNGAAPDDNPEPPATPPQGGGQGSQRLTYKATPKARRAGSAPKGSGGKKATRGVAGEGSDHAKAADNSARGAERPIQTYYDLRVRLGLLGASYELARKGNLAQTLLSKIALLDPAAQTPFAEISLRLHVLAEELSQHRVSFVEAVQITEGYLRANLGKSGQGGMINEAAIKAYVAEQVVMRKRSAPHTVAEDHVHTARGAEREDPRFEGLRRAGEQIRRK